jgi:hypothetical protein
MVWVYWAVSVLWLAAVAFFNGVAYMAARTNELPPADWPYKTPQLLRLTVVILAGAICLALSMTGRLPSDREGRAAKLSRLFLPISLLGAFAFVAAVRFVWRWDFFSAVGAVQTLGALSAAIAAQPPPMEAPSPSDGSETLLTDPTP